MKNTLIKKIALGTMALMASFGMALSTAFAAGAVLNQDPQDLKTVRVSNYSAVPGSMTWGSTVNSAAGQIVSVGIYYHNNGTSAANNLRIRLSPQTSASANSHTFTATVSSDNSNTVTDTATVTVVGGSEGLSYIPTAVYWYPNQACKNNPGCQPTALPSGQNGSELFGSGLNLGTIAPGWSTQGGLSVQFKVSSNGGSGQTGQAPTVSTNPVSMLDSANGSATLNGYFNSNGLSTTTSFRYRVNGGSWTTVGTTNRGISNSSISFNIANLSSGSYEYQAVATNSADTVYGQSQYFTIIGGTSNVCPSGTYGTYPNCIQNPVNPTVCGYNQYWNGSYCVTNQPSCGYNQYWNGSYCVTNQPVATTGMPSASTLGTISVGATAAAVDGYYTANGCDAFTSFRYGTTQSFGSQTSEVSRGNGTGSMAQSISGLSPNTTYYYQAQVRNCVGTTQSTTVRSFTTSSDTSRDVVIRTITSNTTTSTGTGSGSIIKLMIDNRRESVGSGRDITYDVSWENLTTRTMKNLVIEVNFPTQMSVLDTDRGSIERNKNSVIYQIDSLGSRETGTMRITTDVTGSLKEGDPVVAQAIAAFENPKTNAAENAIAYDADTFSAARSGSVLGASLFGLDFLPSSLAGWLIILLIILVIVILAHSYVVRQRAGTVAVAAHPVNVPNIPMEPVSAPSNDYIVYRPTPKQ